MEPTLVLVAGKGEGRVWAAHPAWTVWGQWQPCCLLHQERNKNAAQELATLLLSLPAPASVQQQSKSLLASLHTSRSAYHSNKVIRGVSCQGGRGGTDGRASKLAFWMPARVSRSQAERGEH